MPTDEEYMALMRQAQQRKNKNQNMLKAYTGGGNIFSTYKNVKDILSSLYNIAESPGFYSLRSLS